MHETCDRRSVLAAAAATVPAVSLAGCLSEVVPGSGGGGRPEYARWLPAESVDGEAGVLFVHAALGEIDDLEDGDLGALPESASIDPGQDGVENADPLGAVPVLGLFVLALSAGFGLHQYGFATNPLSGAGSEPTPTDTPTDGGPRPETVLLVDGVFVFRGEFTADGITGDVPEFDVAGERAGYTIYEGTGDESGGTGGLVFAVTDGTLVVPPATGDGDLRSRLDAVLDVRHGDATSLAEAEADVDWLVRTAGGGHVVLGAWETSYETDAEDTTGDTIGELGRPRGLVGGLTLATDATTGAFAAVFPDGETPTAETVREHVGTTADDRTVSVEGTRVSVAGTWRAESGS